MVQLIALILVILITFGLIYLSSIVIGVTLYQALGVCFIVMGGLSILGAAIGTVTKGEKK